MAYWLMKTEPEEFSWDDQVKRGAKGEPWSGVRNFTARRHLKEMKKGEKFFFYHTGAEKQVVGIGEIIREAYPDPTAEKGEPWVAVDHRGGRAVAEAGDARRDQSGAEAERYGAGEIRPPLGAAGDGGGMEARLQDGRREGLTFRDRRGPAGPTALSGRTNPDMALSPVGPSSHNALGRTLYGPSPFEAPPTKVGGSHLRVTDYR